MNPADVIDDYFPTLYHQLLRCLSMRFIPS